MGEEVEEEAVAGELIQSSLEKQVLGIAVFCVQYAIYTLHNLVSTKAEDGEGGLNLSL